jgi:hypothetical protein
MLARRVSGAITMMEGRRDTPSSIEIGQHWSVWVPSRRQWLLATVIRHKDHNAILQYDTRYGVAQGQDEHVSDMTTMLGNTQLFRFIMKLV